MNPLRRIKKSILALAVALGAASLGAAPLTNGDFMISDPVSAGYGWTSPGGFSVAAGTGMLVEDGIHTPVSASQTFDLPADAVLLHIVLDNIDLRDNGQAQPLDAFQISLLSPSSVSLVGVTPQSETTALFSFQRDGTLHYGADTAVPGAGASGTTWTPSFPATISIDLSGINMDVAATLALDLIGLDAALSSVTIGEVFIEGLEPTANDDSASTDEETLIAISVLANDAPATGKTLDPASIMIVDGPDHGTTMIDTVNGRIEYMPSMDYAGPDDLTYTVADTDGNRSDPATVSLTVNPVNDRPTIQAPAAITASKQTAKVVAGVALADVDAASSDVTFTLNVSRGILSLAENVSMGLVANQITGNDSASLSVTAPLDAINATLADANGLTYTGLLNLIGADTLQLGVNDNNHTGSGGALSGSANVAINVTGSLRDLWRNQRFDLGVLTDPAKEATHWGDAADPDMDMQDNGYEFVADTDPNSAASKFEFHVAPGVSGIELRFSPVSVSRSYSVEFVDRVGQAFAPFSGGSVRDEGQTRIVSVPGSAAARFFRVRIDAGE